MAAKYGFKTYNNTNEYVKEAIIYSRVSTTNQLYNSSTMNTISSIETQNKVCSDYCKRNNYKVVGNVNEVSSAYNKIPAKLKNLISIDNLDKTIVIYAIDRFSRNVLIGSLLLEEAKKYNITIEFVADNFTTENDRHILQIKGEILRAEHESRIIGSRIKARNEIKRSKGWIFGAVAKYGNKFVMRNGIRKLTKNAHEQKVIKFILCAAKEFKLSSLNRCLRTIKGSNVEPIEIYDNEDNVINDNLYNEKLTTKNIVELLNTYEIFNRNDKPWTTTAINRVIKQNTINDREQELSAEIEQLLKNIRLSGKLNNLVYPE
jgi:DNA invertase Pin-like site-specific DNA recombinase